MEMKTYIRTLLTIIISIAAFGASLAQNGEAKKPVYKITGKIMEKDSDDPVAYGTVALVSTAEGKVVSGAVADMNGNFAITGFGPGFYKVQVSFVGYETFSSATIEVTSDNPSIDLGSLRMEGEVKALQEVTIVGQRELIQEKVDRTIYNAENDKTLMGGDATDVMRRVPMLSVDLDGNVSMRGSTNILVLIDGRQSAIVAANVTDALKQIPAEQIKSIEVITSPSAKYDAEGTGGVINIVTKKNNLQGASLNINSSAGYRGSNLGLNASLKKGKMGWTLGGWGRSGYNILGSFENQQAVTNAGTTFDITQSAQTRSNMLFGRYSLGWDYEIDKLNFLTASLSFGVRNNNNYQDGLLTETYLQDELLSAMLRDVNIENLSNNVNFNFNYTRTYAKPQREFSVSTLYSKNNTTNDFISSLYDGTFVDVISRIKNNNAGINEELALQIDYVTPFGTAKGQMLEYGAKTIQRQVISDFSYATAEGSNGQFQKIDDVAFSNEFNYQQNVTAAYASVTTNVLTKYTFKGGLRYEYTNIDANFTNSELGAEIPSFGLLVPSMNLSRKLGNGNMVKAAYNRRVQRPSLTFLNPNINAANPQQVSQGNPLLDPELTDNYELSYSTFFKGSSLNFTSYFRNTTQSIQPIRTVQDNDVIFTTFENIGQEQAFGLSVFSNVNISSKFSINGSVDTYYATLDNGIADPLYAASNDGFVISGRLFANYTLPKNWQVQTFSFARGRQVQLQGTAGGFAMYGLNFNKQLAEKRGSLGVGVENFLAKEFVIRNEMFTPSIMQNSTTRLRNMNFKVNFSYRIGKLSVDQQRGRKKRSINNDDLKEGADNSNMINNN